MATDCQPLCRANGQTDFVRLLTRFLWISGFALMGLASASAQPSGIRVSDASIVEGNSGLRTVEVSVMISPPAASPLSLSYATRNATAGAADYVAASGTVNFARNVSVQKIAVTVIGDTAVEANEKFEVVLSSSSGATISRSVGSVIIVNDDFAAGYVPSVYEVRFTFSGHTGSLGSAPDCPVRPNGKLVMSGLLSGIENVPEGDNIVYTGELQFDADVDMCEGTGEGDTARLCSITTRGSGPVQVELTVNYDDHGAYIKAAKAAGFESAVNGSCDLQQLDEERAMYPDQSMAMIFNGLDLPLDTTKLRVGRYTTSLRPGEVVVEVLRAIRP